MSNMYEDENLDVVQNNEIGPSGDPVMAPDAIALGGPTHHQGADYGLPDTTVTVVDGMQAVHAGVVYGGGETADVPVSVAEYWVRSGWATCELGASEPEALAESDAEPEPVKAPAKGVRAGSGRRAAKQ